SRRCRSSWPGSTSSVASWSPGACSPCSRSRKGARAMDYGFTTAAYVVAAVLFILSLGGLSGQESAKRAVWYGIVGMALAVLATLAGPGSGLWPLSVLLVLAGGVIGWIVAQRVQMTEMPQLVAAMHSLVGLAA